jgi:hypothetical protein
MPGRIEEWMGCVSLNLHHSLNNFSSIAHAFGLERLKKQLMEKRRELENSPVYTE